MELKFIIDINMTIKFWERSNRTFMELKSRLFISQFSRIKF